MLTLRAPETFTGNVHIPMADGKTAQIVLTFRHKSRTDLNKLLEPGVTESREDKDVVKDIVTGWSGVDSEFTPDNLATLLDQYHGAARAILAAYIEHLYGARLGN